MTAPAGQAVTIAGGLAFGNRVRILVSWGPSKRRTAFVDKARVEYGR